MNKKCVRQHVHCRANLSVSKEHESDIKLEQVN